MDSDFGFRVCRVCLAPKTVHKSSSLFEHSGEKPERFREMSGIDISIDKGKHAAIICKTCLHDVERAYTLKQLITDTDQNYFQKKRQQYEERQLIEFVSDQVDETMNEIYDGADRTSENLDGSIQQSSENYESGTDDIVDFENQILFESERFKNQMILVHTYKDLLPKNIAKDQEISLTTIKDITLVDVPNEEHDDGANGVKDSNRSHDLEEKKFKCETCHKVISSQSHLQRHIKNVHKKIKRFACDKCPMKFYHKQNLLKHIKCHVKNPKFKPHIITSADSSRRFKCNFANCGKYFLYDCHLQRHKATHSDARPFICDCGKTYKSEYNLNYHQLKFHC